MMSAARAEVREKARRPLDHDNGDGDSDVDLVAAEAHWHVEDRKGSIGRRPRMAPVDLAGAAMVFGVVYERVD